MQLRDDHRMRHAGQPWHTWPRILKRLTVNFMAATALAAILWLSLDIAPAQAGSFRIRPTRLIFSAQQRTQSFSVVNPTDAPVVVQLSMKAWSQQQGEDVYTDSRDLLVTPPIITVPPGATQTVRAGLRKPPDAAQERTYRLIAHEVPTPSSTGVPQIQVVLRLSLPVFVLPRAPVKMNLRWRTENTSNGGTHLHLHNDGNSHVQVHQVRLVTADHTEVPVKLEGLNYVLPGQTKQWPVDAQQAGAFVQVVADTDQGEFRTPLHVAGH